MRRWILGALVSLVAAAQAESQPRAAVVADRAALRVESGGNELVALRDAPEIGRAHAGTPVTRAPRTRPAAGKREPRSKSGEPQSALQSPDRPECHRSIQQINT